MKFIPVILVAILLLAAMPALAQEQTIPAQVYEVPAIGYSSNDTYFPEDLWNEYQVHVPKGYELEYSFEVTGDGDFSIYLIPEIGTEYIFQGNYYISFSSDEPVTSYSATFPVNPYGFSQDYTIVINSTYYGDLEYTASIHINEIEAKDYTLYYVLTILGVVGLVVFSWQLVVWQEKQKKKEKEAAKKKRNNKRGKNNR